VILLISNKYYGIIKCHKIIVESDTYECRLKEIGKSIMKIEAITVRRDWDEIQTTYAIYAVLSTWPTERFLASLLEQESRLFFRWVLLCAICLSHSWTPLQIPVPSFSRNFDWVSAFVIWRGPDRTSIFISKSYPTFCL
jgi:hypothetical protein